MRGLSVPPSDPGGGQGLDISQLEHCTRCALQGHPGAICRRGAPLELCLLRDFTTTVLDTMGSLIVILDPRGQVVRFNHACMEVTGFTLQEVLGRSIWELLHAPDERDAVEKIFAEVLTGASVPPYVHAWRTKTGESRQISWSSSVLWARDGSVAYVIQTGLDVTERMQAERALRESELRYRSMFDHSIDAVLLATPDGRVLAANPAAREVFGYQAPEFAELCWWSLFDSHDGSLELALEEHARKGRFRGEVTGIRRDGSRFPAEISTSLFRDLAGNEQASLMIQDLTEHRAADQAKDDFIAMVSHELRTPMTSIHGSLMLLAHGALGPLSEGARDMVDVAVRNTERLVRLVHDILDADRLKRGKLDSTFSACDASELMWQACEVMRGMAREAEVRLQVEPFSCRLWADPDRLIQTLTNLLSNALKFSPPGGIVRLSATRQADQLLMLIEDQGRGIPADHLERIFDRFAQVDVSDAREKGGAGLGLTISREIVAQHGGKIWAESATGTGTRFWVSLPVMTPGEA